jgi:hypothetical protein
MKHHLTQLAVRENTALSRPHASRLATDVRSNSICIKEKDLRSRLSASRNEPSATDSGNPSYTAAECAATGGETLADEVSGEPEFLTVSEVALRLRVTKNWVYNHARSLGVYHLGKYLRFSWPKVLEKLGDKS